MAADIRDQLGLPMPPAAGLKSWEACLQRLVAHAEEAGIVVLQSDVALGDNRRSLSVEEFCGFTLVDDGAQALRVTAQIRV